MSRRHFSELPDVPGFTRIADGVDARGRYAGRRLRCDVCGDEIPSLGVGYHKNGRPCVERKAERLAKEARRAVRAREREQKRLDELEHEEDDYAGVADELNDGSPDQLTIDDLDPRMVERARRYAEREQLPWPPGVGDFDEYYLRRVERERREKVRHG